MTTEIEFFFDCSSPWTYVAFHNIQPLAKELGVPIRWRPILVGGVFNAVNQDVYQSRLKPVRGKQDYMIKSLHQWAELSNLKLRFPGNIVFPVNSVKVMRACLILEPSGMLPAFARAAFEAYWRDNQDISLDSVFKDVCVRAGVDDPDQLLSDIERPEVKQELRANTQALIDRGGFGSPSMFLAPDDMYFGNDHLPILHAAIKRHQADTAAASGKNASST